MRQSAATRFDNASGYLFPLPEGTALFADAAPAWGRGFIPPTERVEAAGFEFPGDNYALRAEVLQGLNEKPAYPTLFRKLFPRSGRARRSPSR